MGILDVTQNFLAKVSCLWHSVCSRKIQEIDSETTPNWTNALSDWSYFVKGTDIGQMTPLGYPRFFGFPDGRTDRTDRQIRGSVQDFLPFIFILAGTIFFEASPNRNKNRQTSNKERDNFWQCTSTDQLYMPSIAHWSITLFDYIGVNCH